MSGPNVNVWAQSGGNLSVATSGVNGTAYVQCPSQRARVCHVVNQSSEPIIVRQDGAGVGMPVGAYSGFSFNGISNVNQLSVKRDDEANTALTVYLRWEA